MLLRPNCATKPNGMPKSDQMRSIAERVRQCDAAIYDLTAQLNSCSERLGKVNDELDKLPAEIIRSAGAFAASVERARAAPRS
jgi:hypothetical protein